MQASGPRIRGRHVPDLILTESIAGEAGNLHLNLRQFRFLGGASVGRVVRSHTEVGMNARQIRIVVVEQADAAPLYGTGLSR